MAAKSQSGGGCLATVLGVGFLFLIGKCAGAVDAAPPPEVPTMPDVTGVHLDVAAEKVDALGEEFSRFPHSDGADLTVNGRDAYSEEEWTVVTSRPLPGQAMPTSLDEVNTYLFVVRNEEWAWLQANPTMPALPTGVTSAVVVGPGGPMEGVADLVEWVYASDVGVAGTAKAATVVEPLYGLMGEDPRFETPEESAAYQGVEMYGGPSDQEIVVGQWPPAGAEVRIGQRFVISVRPVPEPEPHAESGITSGDVTIDGDVYYDDDDDDDDDFNVPGWLCPTRWC